MAALVPNKEVESLRAMRENFAGFDGYGMVMDDRTYLRYLRARNYDSKKATSMLHATLAWRKDFGVQSIIAGQELSLMEVENASGKLYVRGFDIEGRAVCYCKPGNENTKSHEGTIRHTVYNMERAIAIMEAKAQRLAGGSDGEAENAMDSQRALAQEKVSLLIDYTGYSSSNSAAFKTTKETLSILQNHYPERLHRAYCVKPPFMFHAFWATISPFIDPVTRNKVVMISASMLTNPNNQLVAEIPRATLESSMGGYDARPFSSQTYLRDGPFNMDFTQILDSSGEASGVERIKHIEEGKLRNLEHESSNSDSTFCTASTKLPSSDASSSISSKDSRSGLDDDCDLQMQNLML